MFQQSLNKLIPPETCFRTAYMYIHSPHNIPSFKFAKPTPVQPSVPPTLQFPSPHSQLLKLLLGSHTRSSYLIMRRHNHTRLRRNRILTPPQTRHSLLLRIKLQPRLSIESIRTTTGDTLLVTREREHGELIPKSQKSLPKKNQVGIGKRGECELTGTGIGTLIPNCPASISRWKRPAVAPERVKIAAPLPYSLLLIKSIASSIVSTLRHTRTGPKISSR